MNNDSADFQCQEAYWNKLQQFKFDLEYYGVHFSECTIIMRRFKYFVIGCTTIVTGVWYSWKEIDAVNIICAVTIILLQALSAVSDLFPYKKRQQEIREMTDQLNRIYIEMENDWRLLANGNYSTEEIQKLIKEYDIAQEDIKRNYLKDDCLPNKDRIIKKASDQTWQYFHNMSRKG